MKELKKYIAILLIVSLAAFAISCGGNEEGAETSDTSVASVTSTASESASTEESTVETTEESASTTTFVWDEEIFDPGADDIFDDLE